MESPYKTYCIGHAQATEHLNHLSLNHKKFSKFAKKCTLEVSECQGLDLASFLLEPVQRIARYPLLLRHILHYTSKSDEDQVGILQALQESERLLNTINDSVRKHEDQRKINNLALMLQSTSSSTSSFSISNSFSSFATSYHHHHYNHPNVSSSGSPSSSMVIVGKTKWGVDRRILCDAQVGRKKRAYLLDDMFILTKKDGPNHCKLVHPPIPILQLTNDMLEKLAFENQYIRDVWMSEVEKAKSLHQSNHSLQSAGSIITPLMLSIIGTIQVSILNITNIASSSSSSSSSKDTMYQCILRCGMGIVSSTSISYPSPNLQFEKDILVLGLASFDDILRIELVKYHPFSPNGIHSLLHFPLIIIIM